MTTTFTDPSTTEFCSSSVDEQQELGQGDSIYKRLTTSMSHKEREDIVLKSLSAKFAKVLQLAVAHLVTVNKHIHELMVF